MRAIAAAALICAAASAAIGAAGTAQAGEPVAVKVHRLPSFAIGSDRTQFGALSFLGGIQIVSRDRRVGGLSGIELLADGATALMVSDNGYLVKGHLDHEGGILTGISQVEVAPVFPGAAKGDPKLDVEDIALGPDRRSGYLGLEWSTEPVIAFDLDGDALGATSRLPIGGADPRIVYSNQGVESVAIFPEGSSRAGSLLAIAEHPGPGETTIAGWIDRREPIAIETSDGYDVSSARFLPGGDLLLLERRFGPAWGVGMRLRRIPADEIGSGEPLSGTAILQAGLGEQIDNMEGLAVSRGPEGRTILTLVSDDNTSILQRTLILQFALPK